MFGTKNINFIDIKSYQILHYDVNYTNELEIIANNSNLYKLLIEALKFSAFLYSEVSRKWQSGRGEYRWTNTATVKGAKKRDSKNARNIPKRLSPIPVPAAPSPYFHYEKHYSLKRKRRRVSGASESSENETGIFI